MLENTPPPSIVIHSTRPKFIPILSHFQAVTHFIRSTEQHFPIDTRMDLQFICKTLHIFGISFQGLNNYPRLL
jgi:hypothetical protein